jgi:hypothetical protein
MASTLSKLPDMMSKVSDMAGRLAVGANNAVKSGVAGTGVALGNLAAGQYLESQGVISGDEANVQAAVSGLAAFATAINPVAGLLIGLGQSAYLATTWFMKMTGAGKAVGKFADDVIGDVAGMLSDTDGMAEQMGIKTDKRKQTRETQAKGVTNAVTPEVAEALGFTGDQQAGFIDAIRRIAEQRTTKDIEAGRANEKDVEVAALEALVSRAKDREKRAPDKLKDKDIVSKLEQKLEAAKARRSESERGGKRTNQPGNQSGVTGAAQIGSPDAEKYVQQLDELRKKSQNPPASNLDGISRPPTSVVPGVAASAPDSRNVQIGTNMPGAVNTPPPKTSAAAASQQGQGQPGQGQGGAVTAAVQGGINPDGSVNIKLVNFMDAYAGASKMQRQFTS